MDQLLLGKRILLTGASRGIGRASAELLLRHGAQLLGVAKNQERLELARQELSELGLYQMTTLAVDLTDRSAGVQIGERLVRDWSGVDIVIFNAGVQYNQGDIMSEPEGML